MTEEQNLAPTRILVIDDEEHVRKVLTVMMTRWGYRVETAENGISGLGKFGGEVYDLVILDLRMPDLDGITVLKRIKEAQPEQMVVMITAYASVDTALGAMKHGAFDYVGKPFKEDELQVVVQNALAYGRLAADNRRLRSEVLSRFDFGSIIGASSPMEKLFKVMAKVSPTKATVLITGESGTGKELVARALHYNSTRKERPMVAVNCAAIPANLIEAELFGAAKGSYTGADKARAGLLEEANHSTLFLDEVGELPLEMQAKLLRGLQEGEVLRVGENTPRKVDLRVIAATNKDLAAEVESGGFREDLFYRLNVIQIHLPPLREREGDVPLLAAHFVDKAARRHGLPKKRLVSEVLDALSASPLKGNVRELENILEQALVMSDGDAIELHDLPRELRGTVSGGYSVMVPPEEEDLKKVLKRISRMTEVKVIGKVLTACGGNRTRAAERLGISRRALITKIQDLNLD